MLLAFMPLIGACSSAPPIEVVPTSTIAPAVLPVGSGTPTLEPMTTRISTELATSTPQITPDACLEVSGSMEQRQVQGGVTQETYSYQIYIPGCYIANPTDEFPLLILFQGLSTSDSLWIELGIALSADELIGAGVIPPLVIVMPVGSDQLGYQDGLLDILLPELRSGLRVRQGREWWTIGGIARGAAWASRIAWMQPGVFSAIGLHSPELTIDESYALHDWLESFDAEETPRVWIDIGEDDTRSNIALRVARIIEHIPVIPTYHQWPGGHDEEYWSSHLEEYLIWYSGP